MTNDMTQGSPTRLLVVFALPVLVGSMLQQGYNLVDGIIVGQHIGVNALAAIGAVTYLDWLMLGLVASMAQGFAIRVAQRFGAGDAAGVRHTVAVALYLTLGIIAVMTVVSLASIRPLLRLLNTPQAVEEDAYRYIAIIFGCMAVPMLSNLAYSIFRAVGDSRTPLLCLIIASLVNILLDLLFIVALGMGVVGAALGTIVAQVTTWPLIAVRLRRSGLFEMERADWRPQRRTAAALLRLGLPMALQNTVALVGVIILQAVVNGFGVLHVAAFASAMRIFFFVKEPAVAFGHAINAFVGQNQGAGEPLRIRRGVRDAMVLMLCICAACMLVLLVLGGWIAALVIPAREAETVAMAAGLLRVFAIALPTLYAMFAYRAALQGMGDTMTPMLSGLVEMVARTALALVLPGLFGFLGIGLAEAGAWIGAAVLLVAVYRVTIARRLRLAPQ